MDVMKREVVQMRANVEARNDVRTKQVRKRTPTKSEGDVADW